MTVYHYQASMSDNNRYLQMHRIDTGLELEGLFISDDKLAGRTGGRSGSTGVGDDWDLPRSSVSNQDFFEYRIPNAEATNGTGFDYFRIWLRDMPSPLADEDDPHECMAEFVSVRHRHWPGEDRAEMVAEFERKLERQVAQAAARIQRARDYAIREEQRKAREEAMRKEVADEFASRMGDPTEHVRQQLRALGFDDNEITSYL